MGILGLLQKRKGVIDLNDFAVGRKETDEPNGTLTSTYAYHTKAFRRGKVIHGEVPESAILRGMRSVKFKEGFDLIKPFKKGSLGWKIFYDTPFMKVQILEEEVDMLRYEIAKLMELSKEVKTPTQVMQGIYSLADTINELRKNIEIVSQEIPTVPIPTPLNR